MIDTALRGCGYDPRTTPLDTLMAAPLGVHLLAAEALTDDNDFDEIESFDGFEVEEYPS